MKEVIVSNYIESKRAFAVTIGRILLNKYTYLAFIWNRRLCRYGSLWYNIYLQAVRTFTLGSTSNSFLFDKLKIKLNIHI